jgi:deazaflavin-dependent oxidoreductase (nitroreductase family)
MSVKVPPSGTRGVPIPRFIAGFASRMIMRQFRRRRGARTRGGIPALALETIGAKSGEPRQAVLGYLEEGADSWLVIASAVGASRHPAWLHNLAKHPEATIDFGDGQRVAVRAESVEGTALEDAWARIAGEAPEYVGYRSKTDREIPVVRLRRR